MDDNIKIGISFAHYGEEREVNATDGELAIFENILGIIETAGQDGSPVRLVRKSSGYVSAVLGHTDIARFKWTDRAKWIELPYIAKGREKTYITDPAEVFNYENYVLGHYYMALSHLLLGFE